MFLGEYLHAIDEKNRLTIPAKFREELAKGCVVTRGFEKNIIIYTSDSFGKLTRRSQTLNPTDPETRALQRYIFSGASDTAPDKSGRILIPPFLRTYAALEDEVFVVGVGEHLEVWSKNGWSEQLNSMNDPAVNSRRFTALNLANTPAGD